MKFEIESEASELESVTTRDHRALAESYLPLLRAMAAKMKAAYPRYEVDDLVSAGAIGLCGAARRFSPRFGATFATFAWPRIKGAMFDWMRTEGPYKRREVEDHRRGVPRAIVVPLDDAAGIPDIHPLPDELFEIAEGAAAARSRLARLPEKSRRFMERIYVDGATLEVAGAEVGVKKSWACRMRKSAIRTLQEAA